MDIPGTLIELADVVIAEREAVSALYVVPGHETADDRSHAHFNEVLREVRFLLQSVRVRRRREGEEGRVATRKEVPVEVNVAEEPGSIYNYLEVEEPQPTPSSRPKRQRPRARRTPRHHGREERGRERSRWVWRCSLQ